MTTTPVISLLSFTANATKGTQLAPQTIGLSNGNFLVVWQDGTAGTGTGWDIMGAIYSPIGSLIGARFQVNKFLHKDSQTEPKLVALPDGGWVMAYASHDLDSDIRFLVVERFDAAGNSVNVDLLQDIVFVKPSGQLYDNSTWELAVDDAGNYTVAFHVSGGAAGTSDVHAYNYRFSDDQRSAEHTQTVQNEPGANDDILGAIATFSNGDIIAVSHEPDVVDGEYLRSAELRITSRNGALLAGTQEFGPTFLYSDNKPKDVAVLTDDRFVIVTHVTEVRTDGTFGHFEFHIGSRNASNVVTIGDEQRVSLDRAYPAGGFSDPDASIVALKDGGFFIAWADFNSNAIRGTRFDAAGEVVGSEGFIVVANNELPFSGNPTLGDLSLTTDGRILVAYRNELGEISEIVLDPRDSTILGNDTSEVITALPTASVIFGNGGHDRIYGRDGQDLLFSGEGDDTVTGGGNNDIVQGAGGHDQLYGDTGNDSLFGELGNDYLDGDIGNDSMDGGAGSDTLRGGVGDDRYTLATAHLVMVNGQPTYAFDEVIEQADSGTDTVFVRYDPSISNAPFTYTLPANVENGVIGGTTIFFLYGNALNNRLTGNGNTNILDGGLGADTMTGGAGDDHYNVENPGDRVVELAGGGIDTVSSVINHVLRANVEDLVLHGAATIGTGNELANRITAGDEVSVVLRGEGGNDTLLGHNSADELRGGAGADSMVGAWGNDRYFVDNAADVVVETADGGNDTVFSTIDWALGAQLEILRLQGTAHLTGTGNELANRLYGNTGSNVLSGLNGDDVIEGSEGADTIIGGAGNDTLTGGSQADQFRFSSVNAGADTITDFNKNADRFDLAGGAFTSMITAPDGDVILTHNGGTIRIDAPLHNLTLAEYNALVVTTTLGAAWPGAGHWALQARNTADIIHIGHGEWVFA